MTTIETMQPVNNKYYNLDENKLNLAIRSSGINVTQGLIAAVEAYVIHSDIKTALIYGGSVMASNLVSQNGYLIGSPTTEKYIAEPIVAGLISGTAMHFMGKKNALKDGFKGFLYGGSSAGLNIALLNFTNYGNPAPKISSYNLARAAAVGDKAEVNRNFILS